MNFLLIILGFLMAFFIPGYILTTLFLKNIRFKIPISMGLSICVVTLVGFILGLFGILTIGYLYGVLLILILIPIFYFKKEIILKLKEVDVEKLKNVRTLTFLLVLLIVFAVILFVRIGHPDLYFQPSMSNPSNFFIPIHADEWSHLAQVKYSMDSGTNSFVNPYFENLPKHLNFESGFHTFTASFFLLTGLDAVKNYYIFAAVFAVLASSLIYSFLTLLTKKRFVGIFGVLFFLSLPSNSSLLGSWFYIPSSMSIFLIFLFLTILYQAKKEKDFYFLGIIFVASLLIYPFVAILLGIIGLFYWFKEREMLRLRIEPIHRGIIAALIFLVLITIIFLTDFKTILSLLIFDKGWRSIETVYSPISLVGVFWLILSLIGLWVMFIRKYEKTTLYILAILGINLLAFYFIDKSFLLMYRINFYYFLLFLGIFGAIGSDFVINFVGKFSRNKSLSMIFKVVAIVLILFILFNGHYEIEEKGQRLNKFINVEEFKILERIGQNFTGKIVMADPITSLAIYPVTGNHVVSLLSSNLGGGAPIGVYYFFNNIRTCQERKQFFETFNLELVISKDPLNCDFLDGEKNGKFYWYTLDETIPDS